MNGQSKHLLVILKLAVAFFCVFSFDLAHSTVVNVGGYNFPPFVERDGKSGLVHQIIEKLNSTQDKYKFVFKLTSANRRYRDLKDRKVDVIFFEDEAWSWGEEKIPHQKTGVILTGGELYVALSAPERDQKYFDSFEGKKIRGIFGYHYNFANMNTDPETLRRKGISLGESNEENLKDLINKKVDVIVINSFIIDELAKKDKDLHNRLLISTKRDQIYQLRIILNERSPISVQEMERLVIPHLK